MDWDLESPSSSSLHNHIDLMQNYNESLDEVHNEVLSERTYRIPIFTVLYALSVLLLFLYGIYFISGEDNVKYGPFSPISPPLEGLYFSAISEWPYCRDTRSEWWRLLSHQVVHAGYMHVLSNLLMLLVFGCFYESHQGFIRTATVFEVSIVAGCMGHAAVWPLRPLIGNSHGVYGLFGATIAEVLVNADATLLTHTLLLLLMLFIQLVIDVIGFVLWFNPHVGYSAHACGFLAGFLLSFAISSAVHKRPWKYVICILSTLAVVGGLWYLLDHYESSWPPETLISPSWSEVSTQTCCADSIRYQQKMGTNQEEVVESFYCDGNEIVEK